MFSHAFIEILMLSKCDTSLFVIQSTQHLHVVLISGFGLNFQLFVTVYLSGYLAPTPLSMFN